MMKDEQEFREMLTKLAARECWCDDEDSIIDDYAGGNIDDAYNGGQNDGEALLARSILKKFFPDK